MGTGCSFERSGGKNSPEIKEYTVVFRLHLGCILFLFDDRLDVIFLGFFLLGFFLGLFFGFFLLDVFLLFLIGIIRLQAGKSRRQQC